MDEDAYTFTRGGNLKKPSILQVCTWVMESWIEIPDRMVVKSFMKCCISNALDGTEDDILFEDDSDDGISDSDIHADVMVSSSDEEQAGGDASDDTDGNECTEVFPSFHTFLAFILPLFTISKLRIVCIFPFMK